MQQAEASVAIKELWRQHGFGDASFYNWRAKFGGMSISDGKRLKELEAENTRLKGNPPAKALHPEVEFSR